MSIGSASSMQLLKKRAKTRQLLVLMTGLAASTCLFSQTAPHTEQHAGYVPLISGGMGYVHNISGGSPSLEPQIDPVLLVPFGSHLLLESRTDFTGFFQRQDQTSGPFKGKVFKNVEFAELDWLADTHVTAVVGKYLLPFGLFNERLEPIWIRNLQDPPLAASIGTRTSGAGDGLMLRGAGFRGNGYSTQYSGYFSAHSGINQLEAARTAGGDFSVYLPHAGLELGTSWQRFLQQRRITNSAAYISWQPAGASLDLKAEYDHSFYGHGYWIETAYRLDRSSFPAAVHNFQLVGRFQDLLPFNGGGNGVPRVRTQRADLGLNYYLRDNLRILSSYDRSLSRQHDLNVWNFGAVYRFSIPLWPERKR